MYSHPEAKGLHDCTLEKESLEPDLGIEFESTMPNKNGLIGKFQTWNI